MIGEYTNRPFMRGLRHALAVLFLFIPLIITSCSNDGHSADQDVDVNTPTLVSATDPGPYTVQMLSEIDGLRDGPDYAGATVYYPMDAEPPFASIVIVPGFEYDVSAIQEWGPFYASHGIVAMTIGTNDESDNPDVRAIALLDAIETLRQENARTGSPLMGQLDIERFAASGWSMGGGGAQLAAVLEPSLKAVVTMCPWLDPDQLTRSDLNHAVPLLIISGQLDEMAPPEEQANIHYEYTPGTTDKLLYEVYQGGHDVANAPDFNDNGISYSNGEVGRVALSWLKVYLVGDISYRPLLFEVPASAAQYETNLQ